MKKEILDHNFGVILVDNQIGIAVVEGKEIAYAPRGVSTFIPNDRRDFVVGRRGAHSPFRGTTDAV